MDLFEKYELTKVINACGKMTHLSGAIVHPEIAAIALQNKAVVYKILFDASARALREIARDPKHLGAEIGFLSVLHTWGSNLLHHPHIHCVVPGGGIALDGTQWTPCRPGFFLPVRVLGRLFRGKFLHELRQSFDRGDLGFHGKLVGLSDTTTFRKYLRSAYAADWVVYAKPPFNGPKQVLRYLAGYTHRVAISNRRLLSMENGRVYFRWKDYRNGGRRRIMRLTATEFLRRFLLHILPKGFQRIRHYGFLANRRRGNAVERCRQLIDATQEMPTQPLPSASDTEVTILCAECGRGTMVCVLVVPAGMWARSAYEDSS